MKDSMEVYLLPEPVPTSTKKRHKGNYCADAVLIVSLLLLSATLGVLLIYSNIKKQAELKDMKHFLDNVVEKLQILQEGYDYMDLELDELENKVLDEDSNVKSSEDYEIVDIVPGPVSKYAEGIQSQGIYDTALLKEIRDEEIEDIMKIGGRDAVAETIASSEKKNSYDSYGKVVPGPVSKYDEGIQSQGIYDTALSKEIRDKDIEDTMKTGGRVAVTETIASSENKNTFDSSGKVVANYYSYKDEDNEELYNRFVNMDDEDLSNEMPLSQVNVWSYYDESPVIW